MCLFTLPIPALASIIQADHSALSSDPPSAVSGWDQELGTGLSGQMTSVSFEAQLTPSETYSPNPILTLYSCATETYQDCGTESWGRFQASFSTLGTPGTSTPTTLTFSTSNATPFDPARFYKLSVSFSLLFGGGQFQVLGAVSDTYTFGKTSSGGLADIAFNIDGIDRTVSSTSPTTTPPAPEPEPEPTPAISSVLFLPGIKGSRLYEPSGVCGLFETECDRSLWLPLSDLAVPKLYLNPDGTSVNPDVYTRPDGLLYRVLGRKFYDSIDNRMRDAQRLGIYGNGWKWQPAAYDWRLGTETLADSGRLEEGRVSYVTSTSVPYLQHTLRDLASTSPTGKVTIIAHSYGGLLAHSLIQALGPDAEQLVDNLVLVGVPEHGAPRAIGSLLFGDREAIPGFTHLPNVILTHERARTFALNSPATYELLPSGGHFDTAPLNERSIISFDSSDRFTRERNSYGGTIDTLEELHSYVANRDGGRMQPAEDDLSRPAVVSEGLLAVARHADTKHDSMLPPGISVHRVIGSGESTVSGLRLYERTSYALGVPTGARLAYEPRFSMLGDGTVPTWSAAGNENENAHEYWVDLDAVRNNDQRFSHANLLESPQVLSLIEGILRGNPVLPSGISETGPETGIRRIRLMLYSPATIMVKDEQGNRTGITPEGTVVEDIPDSLYGEFGTHAYVELVPGRSYTAIFTGTATGTISWSLASDETGVRTELLDLPVSPGSSYELSFTDTDDIQALTMDADGDGVSEGDITIVAGTSVPYVPVAVEPSQPPSTTDDEESSGRASGSSCAKRTVRTSNEAIQEVSPDVFAAGTYEQTAVPSPDTGVTIAAEISEIVDASSEMIGVEVAIATSVPTTSSELVPDVSDAALMQERWWQRLLRMARELLQAAVALAF